MADCSATGTLPREPEDIVVDDDFDQLVGHDESQPCPVCGGSGVTMEGWDCGACDGMGTLGF